MAKGLGIPLELPPAETAAGGVQSKRSESNTEAPVGQGSQAPEPTILQRIASGDQSAVSDCLDAYDRLVWSLARRYLRNQADAEDAVQDIFIEIWKTAGRYNPKVASEVAFISTITRRRLIDRVRQNRRRPSLDSIDDQVGANQPAVASTVDDDAEVAQVVQVLQGLEPQKREILSRSLYEGYSHSEIAKMMGMPLGTVKTRLRRGLMEVRDKMQLARETA